MQSQFDYLNELAANYRRLADNPDQLFRELNSLSEENLNDIYADFGDTELKYQPVRLLRATAAHLILQGEELTKAGVEAIKQKIREKDVGYFPNLPTQYQTEFSDYPEPPKRDIFANWQKDWNVFHPFFYRGTAKQTAQVYLAQISRQLLKDLGLDDHTFHSVDFYGANNFGATHCWLALFPQNKASHKDSNQFFVKFDGQTEVGRILGSNLSGDSNNTKIVQTYEEVCRVLEDLKPTILEANSRIRNYFKFAPGENAYKWEEFHSSGLIAVSYNHLNLGDISAVSSREQLNLASGFAADSSSNLTWNLWLFKNANKGDVVFASRGTMTCIGIGIITGDYYFDANADDYQHRRKVEWITDAVYQYEPYSYTHYPRLFRVDTFSPTLVHEFLLSEYVRLFPHLAEVFDGYNLNYTRRGIKRDEETSAGDVDEIQVPREPANFWWLVANPSIWSFADLEVGGRQTYTSRNDSGNKRRIFKNFSEVQPGDLVIGYESSPVRQIKAIFEISRSLHQTEAGRDSIELELTEKLDVPVYLNELQESPLLQKSEPFQNNLQGSLFKLSEDEFDLVREIIADKNLSLSLKTANEVSKYTFASDPDRPFISESNFQQIVELLKRKKNIILEGPPGVGKTFLARKIAYEIMQSTNDSQIEMVQFHQSFAYEDFIQGFRPGRESFVLKNGIFYSFCQQALSHPNKYFFFIIDEINRGNLSKILGEMMMLIESDKRDEKYALKLTYAEDEDDRFYVPPNLYLIGTMNTADRSLAIVDYALRRRFAFVRLNPEFGDSFLSFLRSKGVSSGLGQRIQQSLESVNAKIKGDPNLGENFQLGHSFFCSKEPEQDEAAWWENVVEYEVTPLLKEIYFDNAGEVDRLLTLLR